LIETFIRLLFCCLSIVSFVESPPQSAINRFLFKFAVLSISFRTSSSFLRLLLRLIVTYALPSIFPSITCSRRHFLRELCPVQFDFLLFIVFGIILSSFILCNSSSFLTRQVQMIFSFLLQNHISKLSSYFCYSLRSVHISPF